MNNRIRNIAIIAHVDHGKTTLVDKLLQAGGAFRENQAVAERAMDSMDLEREKGITIRSKNTSVHWGDKILNIIDTPGHADFGGEVERVMKMVDGVLLVVDALDGPQAQTRFVLRKALQQGIKPIVVINKIDRDNSQPALVHDKVLELFLDLEATEEQFNAPFLYGTAKGGFFVNHLSELEAGTDKLTMMPLLEAIFEHIPAPQVVPGDPFKMLISNISWDDYVGRVALGKIQAGEVQRGDSVFLLKKDGSKLRGKVTKVFEYSGLGTSSESSAGVAGNIVGIAGFEELDIGETLAASEDAEPLPFMEIDPPTIQMQFSINDGPFGGRDGKYVTSRQIRDRLWREMKTNISIQVEDTELSGLFSVSARGAMQIAVLVEQMRREGFEVLVSRPMVIFKKDEEGRATEPFETLYLEVPDEHVNPTLRSLNQRRGILEHMEAHNGRTDITAVMPTRGIIGFEFELMNMTSGHGVMSHLFKEYAPHAGEITTRQSGTLVSIDTGEVTAYALETIQDRGKLFVAPQDQIYQGQIVGENPRQDDLPVNPCRAKQLNNMRSSGSGVGITLAPPVKFTLERAIEYIANDELVEATPNFLRLRKRILDPNERRRVAKREASLGE